MHDTLGLCVCDWRTQYSQQLLSNLRRLWSQRKQVTELEVLQPALSLSRMLLDLAHCTMFAGQHISAALAHLCRVKLFVTGAETESGL